MVAASVSLESLCVNSIRMLAVDAVNKSNSGHPGLPMGCAPMGYALWQNILNHNPNNPKWFNRDRFVLSAGHGCMLLYSLLHLTGYKSVSIEDIKEFRQWGSKTPGHPETFETEGVEVTAGPLGAGISNAVGLAIAETHLAAKFNKPDCNIVDHYTYVIMGDGCNQEGIASEACSLAGHLKLGKLIALYDDNQITIDGRTDVSFTEDVLKRYEAYGWHVQHVEDGNHDVKGITEAIEKAKLITSFSPRGLIAEHGTSWMLPRIIGPSNALDLMWSSRRVDANEAYRIGYANRISKNGEALKDAQDFVKSFSKTVAPYSLMMMKRQVYQHLNKELGIANIESTSWMDESLKREDFKEGINSFLEKRLPNFKKIK